jgi:predicted DsbA family dithiol-disulfide isomerase
MRFCSVFGDAHNKVETTWGPKGGFEGFNAHLREVAEKFPHIELSEAVWKDVRPHTSSAAHLFLKAVMLVEGDEGLPEARFLDAVWAMRHAFFAEGRDVSAWGTHEEIAEGLGIDFPRVEAKIRSGEAMAFLDADLKLGQELGVAGSPTFVMNEGRQKLFGNVGYRLIEANLEELLRQPKGNEASWC